MRVALVPPLDTHEARHAHPSLDAEHKMLRARHLDVRIARDPEVEDANGDVLAIERVQPLVVIPARDADREIGGDEVLRRSTRRETGPRAAVEMLGPQP